MDEEENIDKSIKNTSKQEENETNNEINVKKEDKVEFIENTRGEIDLEETEKIVEQRKKQILSFLKNKQIWVLGFLIIAIILGVYIRSLPMQDHGGHPGLWDITTNTWTLGPDLDPWLFERYAKTIVEQGSLPKIDTMKNVPLGFDTSGETQLLPYMIAGLHKILNIFGDYPVIFAAAFFPVIMFALTIISFFLFVREIFIRKTKESITKSNIIALISTFFMIVIPIFLSRTIAGIPEKESAAFFFMFLAFYLFLRAWKFDNIKKAVIFGILAGIATGLMGLISGLVVYIFVTIALTTFVGFILNKINRKQFVVYFLWIFLSSILMLLLPGKATIKGLVISLDSGLAFLVLFILIIHFVLWDNKLSNLKVLRNSKLPRNIISLIIAIILGILLVSIAFGPSLILDKIKALNQIFFKPVVGRWNITVAENRQPYFTEWAASFGPFLKNLPVLFWLFFIGSVVLFKKMLNKIKNKDACILTGLYVLFFFGLVFSRYSASSTFNGENSISKTVYYLSSLILILALAYYYIRYHRQGDLGFEKINFEYLLLFSLLILCLFTARSAVRLIMVLGPVAPIFLSYLIVESGDKFKKAKDETWKIFLGATLILLLILSIFTFWSFYKSVKAQAYGMVPSAYNQQWQKAMDWVRKETPENAVFGHWWDYGYWLQSIGNRATVLDGGNSIVYWNYLMGRYVLTGDNQKDALEFLYAHNTTHLLIDSSDIGKYTAFSSIGSDKNYDRYSWIGAFLLDEKQTLETNNQTIFVYSGGIALDEDMVIHENERDVLLPGQKTGVVVIVLPVQKREEQQVFLQPYIIAVYQGRQYKVNLKYLFVNGKFMDFGSGIEAVAYVFPRLIQQGQGVNQNPIGAAMFISPKLLRGMLAQIYLLNDPFNKFPNFKLVHTEQNLIIDSLKQQGMALPDFIYLDGIQGPIKIWEIQYTGKEELKQEYLDRDYRKYIDWRL